MNVGSPPGPGTSSTGSRSPATPCGQLSAAASASGGVVRDRPGGFSREPTDAPELEALIVRRTTATAAAIAGASRHLHGMYFLCMVMIGGLLSLALSWLPRWLGSRDRATVAATGSANISQMGYFAPLIPPQSCVVVSLRLSFGRPPGPLARCGCEGRAF